MIIDDSGWQRWFAKTPVRVQFRALTERRVGFGGYLTDETYVDLIVVGEWVYRKYNANLDTIGVHPYNYRMTPDGSLTWRPGDAELVDRHSPWDRADGSEPQELSADILEAHLKRRAELAQRAALAA